MLMERLGKDDGYDLQPYLNRICFIGCTTVSLLSSKDDGCRK